MSTVEEVEQEEKMAEVSIIDVKDDDPAISTNSSSSTPISLSTSSGSDGEDENEENEGYNDTGTGTGTGKVEKRDTNDPQLVETHSENGHNSSNSGIEGSDGINNLNNGTISVVSMTADEHGHTTSNSNHDEKADTINTMSPNDDDNNDDVDDDKDTETDNLSSSQTGGVEELQMLDDVSLNDTNENDEAPSEIIPDTNSDNNDVTNDNVETEEQDQKENQQGQQQGQQQQQQQQQPQQQQQSLEEESQQPTNPKNENLTAEEKIAILTKERDAAQQVSKELLERLSNSASQKESEEHTILLELQSSLQTQMTRRAESEHQVKEMQKQIISYQTKLSEYSDMEDEVQRLETNVTQIMVSKTSLEQEVTSLRLWREEYEHKSAILSNRLNEAKKKEATKSSTASRLEADNTSLKDDISTLQSKLDTTNKAKDKLGNNMEKLKKKCIDRIQLTETALVEERNLNEQRKKKMKLFVEAKAEELRSAKNTNDELRSDLNKTSEALNHVRTKLHHMTEMYDSTSTKNRELYREMARIKKNTEQLHNLGSNLEFELHKSAQETEEHKQKRNTAKHELMTMLRKLEAEQSVSEKLRDSIKFTFTPKALSQQQLLSESLLDFETELLKLSRRLGKTLPPKTGAVDHDGDGTSNEGGLGSSENGHSNNENGTKMKKNGKVNSRSEWDTTRLLSNLEHETQFVSREIMALSNSIERLHVLLDDSGEKTCVSTLNDIFNAMATAKNDTPDSTTSGSDGKNLNSIATNMNGFTNTAVNHYDDEDDSFTGSPVVKGRTERYGLVQQGD